MENLYEIVVETIEEDPEKAVWYKMRQTGKSEKDALKKVDAMFKCKLVDIKKVG